MAKKQTAERIDKYSWAVEGARVLIKSYPLMKGEYGVITQRPTGDTAVVLVGEQRELIPLRHLEQVADRLTPQSVNKTEREYLTLDEITIDGGTQSRAKLNLETIEEYATDMAAGAEFPPVEVYYDGERYWLADGFHRLAAYKKNQELDPDNGTWQNIAAKIHQGDRRDAILHSVGANSNHGLRRTNADKRRAVTTLLVDKEWSQWSNREIAKACGVSLNLVNTLRKDTLKKEPSELKVQIGDDRLVMRNGKTYTMNTAQIGKGDRSLTGDIHKVEDHQTSLEETSISPTQLSIQPQDLVNPPKSKHNSIMPDVDLGPDVPLGELPATPVSFVNVAALNHGKPEQTRAEWVVGFMSQIGDLTASQKEAIGDRLIQHMSQEQLEVLASKVIAFLNSDRYVKAARNLDSIACRAMIKANKQVLNERYHPEYFKGESA